MHYLILILLYLELQYSLLFYFRQIVPPVVNTPNSPISLTTIPSTSFGITNTSMSIKLGLS